MSPHHSFAPLPRMPPTVAIPLLPAVINKEANATDIALREKKSLWGDVSVAGGIILPSGHAQGEEI